MLSAIKVTFGWTSVYMMWNSLVCTIFISVYLISIYNLKFMGYLFRHLWNNYPETFKMFLIGQLREDSVSQIFIYAFKSKSSCFQFFRALKFDLRLLPKTGQRFRHGKIFENHHFRQTPPKITRAIKLHTTGIDFWHVITFDGIVSWLPTFKNHHKTHIHDWSNRELPCLHFYSSVPSNFCFLYIPYLLDRRCYHRVIAHAVVSNDFEILTTHLLINPLFGSGSAILLIHPLFAHWKDICILMRYLHIDKIFAYWSFPWI